MKKNISVIVVCSLILAILGMAGCASESAVKSSNSYEQTWESLAKHQIPEWFRDAKFGIYTH